jgi:hypothetical protein
LSKNIIIFVIGLSVIWGEYSNPTTTQETREIELIDLEEYEIKYRRRRLPNSYDDIPVDALFDKSWKDLSKRYPGSQ